MDSIELGRVIQAINTHKNTRSFVVLLPSLAHSVWFEHTPTERADKSIWRTGKGRRHWLYFTSSFQDFNYPYPLCPHTPIWCCICNNIVTSCISCKHHCSKHRLCLTLCEKIALSLILQLNRELFTNQAVGTEQIINNWASVQSALSTSRKN